MKASRRLLTVDETAQYLGLAPVTVRKGLGRKAKKPFPVKPIRIGRAVRFDVNDLNAFIEASKDNAKAA
ncbi:MAG: helix-turn-helix domain-containing protein [Desulfobulbaceae bacterium]|jgi:predicted DNA-binding transcriptional regulator AlpA